MAESNQQPPLCPCGFFGSPTTAGLCSKCYKAKLQREGLDGRIERTSGSGTVASDRSTTSDTLPVAPTANDVTDKNETVAAETNASSGMDVTVEPCDTACATTGTDLLSVESTSPSLQRREQKNKKRCFKCNQRLELAFTEIGRCKCGYVFCEHHRLPEQHDCEYNHKEKGRQEALGKMISPKKHIGTSLRRLDSDN